ncbi:hypothetical protein [Roseivirga spongicola]|uniref:hypothetical protein n=1 Tax=Roseivirga spongicola TaxID=333140 RepID=UPI002AC9E0EE|nr:hypothetical protein [Roseivirga spongicola]WPZ12261.1 hypothetical protein T7867_09075 [Roseivirga spongicola]
MSIKYLYLDDEIEELTRHIPELLSSEDDELEIDLKLPKSFGEEIQRLRSSEYDGLILDLRLDVKSEAEYRAFTLAQELRTRATEGTLTDIPIVVCSTDAKLKKSYNKDGTGHDLFDSKYLKEEDLVDNSEVVAKELVAFAKGYKHIAEIKAKMGGRGPQLKQMFQLSAEELKPLDVRLTEHFGEVTGRLPVHEYARFILREMIWTSGPLIDRKVLAARLGLKDDSPGFNELIETKFNQLKYKGPFHEGWDRWWWHLVDQWWRKTCKSNLAFLDAQERASQLTSATNINGLNAAEPLDREYATKFWTICALYQLPLDPIDAIRAETKNEPLPWQDNLSMSIKAALDVESKANNLFPHQLEKERVNELKTTGGE